MPSDTLLSQVYLKFNGSAADEHMMLNLVDVTVESSLHLPDVATIVLHDSDGKWVDNDTFTPGSTLIVTAKLGQDEHQVFDGEIVELESDLVPGERRLTIRAFDRLHRLARGRKVESYVQMSDGDIIQKIASSVGLTASVGATPTVHDLVIQDNRTNLEFLRERAAMLGFLLWVQGKTLHCDEHGKQSTAVNLSYGENLREFHPRLSAVDQVSKSSATGWDPKQKKTVLGESETLNGAPKLSAKDEKSIQGSLAAAFGTSPAIQLADRPIRQQDLAQKLAQAAMDRRMGRLIEAEGVTTGIPDIVAGVKVNVSQLGSRFSGEYFVTSATHTYNAEAGYVTRFTVSGYTASTLLSVLGNDRDITAPHKLGLVIGVVTDNKDPDGHGRVKVKYPWLSEEHASDWARVVAPGAGSGRGIQFLPEVNDEVLVGFEQGNIDFPYVLGGLWNGQDALPKASNNSEVLNNGNVNQRIIKSRTGHIVILDDSDDAPFISIVDNTGKNTIKLDSKNNKLTVHLEQDMLFEAPNGDISIKGKTVNVEATDALKVKGQSVDAEAQTDMNLKAASGLKLKGATADVQADASMSIKGATTEVKGSAQLSLDGGAMTEVKGGIINVG